MADLTVVKGDYGYNIEFTVQDSAGSAYNLTGYTIKLKVWTEGSPGSLLVDGAVTISVAADGTCTYPVANGDFKKGGLFQLELELTKAGARESTRSYSVEVTESG